MDKEKFSFNQKQIRNQMKAPIFPDKNQLADGWKRDLAAILKDLGLIDERYTGKISLNFSRGAISDVERTERLK